MIRALGVLLVIVLPRIGWTENDAGVLGARVYGERCAACHGDEGRGDGPAALALKPPPRNFRVPEFWRGRTDVQIRLVVEHGRPGTLMAGFKGVLSRDEIAAVVRYVIGFRGSQDDARDDARHRDGEIPDAGGREDAPGGHPGS